MSKVSLHCQGVPSWTGAFLDRAHSTHVKVIGNYLTFPGVETIGRVYYDQGQVDARVREGAVGADAMFAAVRGEVLANPQVAVWETPANEASIWDASVAAGYVAFNQRLIQLFHSIGRGIIIGAVNTGWPRLPTEDGGAMARLIAEACQGADGVSCHEYGWEDMRQGAGYQCLRYRNWYPWCRAQGYAMPPLYVTETGLDRTSPPGPDNGHSGWIDVLGGNENLYVEMLVWYESELLKDDYVKCATVFTAGPSGWWTFDMYEGVSMKLADAIRDLEPDPGLWPPVAVPDMARGLFVSEFQSIDLDWDAIYADGYRFIQVRTSIGLHEDDHFQTHWERIENHGGFLRSLFHGVTPYEIGQAKFFRETVGGRHAEMGIWGDFEGGVTREKADAFLPAADRNFGLTCNVYSSAGWINSRGGYAEWEAQGRNLWLAAWDYDWLPTLPNGATRWTTWQWGCFDPAPPFISRVCLDRFAGTEQDLYETYGEPPTPPEPPTPTGIRYFDRDGNEHDEAWWEGIYGDGSWVDVVSLASGVAHVVELHDSGLDAGMDFQVVIRGEVPADFSPVLHWPDGNAPLGKKSDDTWEGAVYACYAPPGIGPYWLTVGMAHDIFQDFGWICETNHEHPQKIVYQVGVVPPAEYTLGTVVEGLGQVAVAPLGPYASGTVVTLQVYPAEGWQFLGWSLDLGGDANPAQIVMDSDKTVKATFIEGTDPVQELIEAALAKIGQARVLLDAAEEDLDEALGLLP